MKKLFLNIIFIISVLTCFSQEPQLSKKQMYQDFDKLTNIINQCNAQLETRKIVTGFHQLDTIKSLRKNIDTITNYRSFRNLLNLALFYVFDAHTRETYEFYNFDFLDDIDTAEMQKRNEYYKSSAYLQTLRPKNVCTTFDYFPISPKYFYEYDSYWLLGNNKIIKYDNTDTIHIECMRIISYNGEDFVKYVEKNCKHQFRYDYLRQKYYYGGSLRFKIPGKGTLKCIQYGKIIEFNIEDYVYFHMNDLIERQDFDIRFFNIPPNPKEIRYNQPPKKIEFFNKDSILFIYIDEMNLDEKFCNEIKEIGKNKKINAIIIDVRSNIGGNDEFWQNILKSIIKNPLCYQIKLAYNDSPIMRKKLKHYPNRGAEKIEWLNNQKVRLISENVTIVPDSNSLKYDGKIFILSDKGTYSAAHSFVNLADQNDQLVSVGCTTGQIEGFGISPILFQLENSKFSFRMACTIDILNCKKAIDIYKDFPEILIFPNIEEEMIFPRVAYNKVGSYDLKSEEYLRKYDSMFKKVLELK